RRLLITWRNSSGSSSNRPAKLRALSTRISPDTVPISHRDSGSSQSRISPSHRSRTGTQDYSKRKGRESHGPCTSPFHHCSTTQPAKLMASTLHSPHISRLHPCRCQEPRNTAQNAATVSRWHLWSK